MGIFPIPKEFAKSLFVELEENTDPKKVYQKKLLKWEPPGGFWTAWQLRKILTCSTKAGGAVRQVGSFL